MKGTISILLTAILLISIMPLTTAVSYGGEAEESDDSEKTITESTQTEDGTATQKGETLRERLKEIKEKRLETLKEMEKKLEWSKYNATAGFKARVINAIQVEKARANYIRARERFIVVKMDLERAKLLFQERQRLKGECKGLGECNITEEDMINSAKNFLGNSADAIIEHLTKVKSKVEENEDLAEEEANEMIAKIDAKIAEIQAAKEQAQNATTKEEIREAAKKINAAWKNIKILTQIHATALINARVGGIIVKSEHLKEKLEKILARMEENGKNVDDIKPMIDEFEAKLKLAQEKYEAAVQKYKEFWMSEDKPEAKEKLEEAKSLMEEAKEALKETNEKLRDIIKAIKEKNGEQEIEEENEDNQTETT